MIGAAFTVLLDLLTVACLLGGTFFMFVGALGVVRLPDVYCRSHAASKCVTLGIIGLLAALVLFVARSTTDGSPPAEASVAEAAVDIELSASGDKPTIVALTKALLVVAFVFVAAPVGSHMLARAAHVAGVKLWPSSLGDELAEDEQAGDESSPPGRPGRSA